MRKKFFAKVSVVLALTLSVCTAFTGCGLFSRPAAEYTIQYSDDAGTHTLTVTKGALYTLESVPYKYGYEFLGLFDAAAEGTQYVGANGAAVAPYPDSESKVLYPQFRPIDYTVILNYGDAAVTGARSLTVAYDAALPALPTDLTLAHNEFTGWYTREGRGGTQVADAYGNIPVVSVLNAQNFELDDETRRTNLYAGFELEKYTVTFHFGGGLADETMQIPYGTPIGSVVPATRNAEKQAVLLWSTRENDGDLQDIFSGNITEAKELYAAEWAPVIELDGVGAEVTPIVARAGTAVVLPTPAKPLAKFLRWETLDGQTANITKMPETSTALKAVWQGKIEFDENGGTEVGDISEPAGSGITLPSPEREGYLFAGWYTADKERYLSANMPSEGIALKAGWYRERQKQVVLLSADEESYSLSWTYNVFEHGTNKAVGPNAANRITLDLSDVLEAEGGEIKLSLHWTSHLHCKDTVSQAGFHFYDDPIVSEANHVGEIVVSGITSVKKQCTFEGKLTLRSNTLYLCYYGKSGSHEPDGYAYDRLYFADIYAEIGYPDTSELFL